MVIYTDNNTLHSQFTVIFSEDIEHNSTVMTTPRLTSTEDNTVLPTHRLLSPEGSTTVTTNILLFSYDSTAGREFGNT